MYKRLREHLAAAFIAIACLTAAYLYLRQHQGLPASKIAVGHRLRGLGIGGWDCWVGNLRLNGVCLKLLLNCSIPQFQCEL